jgi:H+-transporting ATPase
MWVEVRGLDGRHGSVLAERALAAVRAVAGVEDAHVHLPWSRIVVTAGAAAPSPDALCRFVDDAEKASNTEVSGRRPIDLPGDAVLVTRAVGAAAACVGLGVALAGRFLRLPRLPAALASGRTRSLP